jgi:hypothetical protein
MKKLSMVVWAGFLSGVAGSSLLGEAASFTAVSTPTRRGCRRVNVSRLIKLRAIRRIKRPFRISRLITMA